MPPELECPNCGEELIFDDLDETYTCEKCGYWELEEDI